MKSAIAAMSILTVSAVATYALTFVESDTDGDGGLSLTELQSVHPEVTEAMFVQADADADGLINADELAAAQQMGLLPADQG